MIYPNTKSSAMFTRRHRGMFQTAIILILIVCIGYSVYLYNLMTIKLKHMDAKTQRYHSQHQSLSSQLQVVYEERSRLEDALLKEKNEHNAFKEKYDQEKQQHAEMEESSRQELHIKYNALKEEHTNTQNKLDEAKKAIQSHQQLKKIAEKEYEDRITKLKSDQLAVEQQKDSQLHAAQEKHRKLSDDHKRVNQLNSDLSSRLSSAEHKLSNYTSLRMALVKIGSDAVKLDHPHFDNLDAQQKQVLLAHLGGSDDFAAAVESQRQYLLKEQELRRKVEEQQQQSKLARDRELALREKARANEAKSRSNQIQVAEDRNLHSNNDRNALHDVQPNQTNRKSVDNSEQPEELEDNNPIQSIETETTTVPPQPSEEPDEDQDVNDAVTESYDDQLAREEQNARNEEARARQELQESETDSPSEDTHQPQIQDSPDYALKHLQNLHDQQKAIAEEQHKNLEELVQQKKKALEQAEEPSDAIVGEITDEENNNKDDYHETPGPQDDDNGENVLLEPQAARVAPNEPEGVGMAPIIQNRGEDQDDYNNDEDHNLEENDYQDDKDYLDNDLDKQERLHNRGDRRGI